MATLTSNINYEIYGMENDNLQQKPEVSIIKVGGKIVEDSERLTQLLDDFATYPGKKILVHGGGRSATKIAAQLGISSNMVNGRRITDADMLQVVTMVYGGLINKNIVAQLQARGINALGLTGADLNLIISNKRPVKDIDYGFVGDVKEINTNALHYLLNQNIVPILAPLTHDGRGQMLNTNADTIAGETAKALASLYNVTLIYCFEKKGVLLNEDDDNSVIPHLTESLFREYSEKGIIQGGMIPKLENSFSAIHAGVHKVIITSASTFKEGSGTIIEN